MRAAIVLAVLTTWAASSAHAQGLPSLDAHGGRLDITCATKLGKWHTEKINGRWWVCTDLGHAFFKQSVYIFGTGYGTNGTSKYGSAASARTAQLNRLLGWHFNTIDINSLDTGAWATAVPAPTPLVPFIVGAKPGLGAMNGSAGPFLGYVVKSLSWGLPGSYYGAGTPFNPGLVDMYDSGIYSATSNMLANQQPFVSIAASPNIVYLMEISLDDADNLYHSFNYGNPESSPHIGWMVLAGSPVQTGGQLDSYDDRDWDGGHQITYLHYDPTVQAKSQLITFLTNRYAASPPACASGGITGINALNQCWGSSYTQYSTTGTTVTGEAIATGDGRSTAYTYALAHLVPAQHSIAVTVNGTEVAADLAHDLGGGGSRPATTTDGRLSAPYWTGTVTFATGALSITPRLSGTAVPRTINKISIAANVVTVESLYQHGLWTGTTVDVSGTTNYNGTNLGPITVVDSYHFTYVKTATLATETAGTYGLHALPNSGDSIAVNYIYNGWCSGTGLADECNNHSWSNSDLLMINTSALTPQMRLDINDFLYNLSFNYFSQYESAIHTYFPTAMYGGPDAMTDKCGTSTSRAPILKAAGQTLDVMTTAYGAQCSQANLDFLYANYGDRPLYDGMYPTITGDSSVGNCFTGGVSIGYTFTTHTTWGTAFQARVAAILAAEYTANESHPYVGYGLWSWTDKSGADGCGLVSPKDNAYDRHEDVTGSVSCSAPLAAYTCGVEPANYGDSVTPTTLANLFWLGIPASVPAPCVQCFVELYKQEPQESWK